MAMYIKTVKIDRFKSLSEVEFDLDKINIFVGSNNSGKTSVIQAVHFGFSLLQSLAFGNKWPGANDRSRSVSPSDLVYVPSNDPYALGGRWSPPRGCGESYRAKVCAQRWQRAWPES